MEGVRDSPDAAPFCLQFVRVPYDVEAELEVARAVGLPDYDAYAAELRHGIYRGDFFAGRTPAYHRSGPGSPA